MGVMITYQSKLGEESLQRDIIGYVSFLVAPEDLMLHRDCWGISADSGKSRGKPIKSGGCSKQIEKGPVYYTISPLIGGWILNPPHHIGNFTILFLRIGLFGCTKTSSNQSYLHWKWLHDSLTSCDSVCHPEISQHGQQPAIKGLPVRVNSDNGSDHTVPHWLGAQTTNTRVQISK